jgi:hypothetical protein
MCASILDRFEKLTKRRIHVWNLIIFVMAWHTVKVVLRPTLTAGGLGKKQKYKPETQ